MSQLKRRIEKLEKVNKPAEYTGFDLYLFMQGKAPPPPQGSYYDRKISAWLAGRGED